MSARIWTVVAAFAGSVSIIVAFPSNYDAGLIHPPVPAFVSGPWATSTRRTLRCHAGQSGWPPTRWGLTSRRAERRLPGFDALRASVEVASAGPPVLDASELFKDSLGAESPLVKDMAAAARQWGFFQIVNHGVDKEVLQRFDAAQEAFFGQDKA